MQFYHDIRLMPIINNGQRPLVEFQGKEVSAYRGNGTIALIEVRNKKTVPFVVLTKLPSGYRVRYGVRIVPTGYSSCIPEETDHQDHLGVGGEWRGGFRVERFTYVNGGLIYQLPDEEIPVVYEDTGEPVILG